MEQALHRDMIGAVAASKTPWAVLVVDDDPGVRQSLRLCLEAAGARVLGVATGGAALEALDHVHFDIVFLDLWLGADSGLDLLPDLLARQPDVGVIVVTAFASIESAVDAIKRGAVDYIPKPFTPDQIRLTASRVLETQHLRRRLTELQEELDESGEPAFFESRSPAFLRFLQMAARAAASEAVLLLRGESGTGKTSEAQVRLLRFLNDHTYERLGDARERRADVRLVAATNRELETEVRAGRFREDLFYRLNVVTLTLPALRERPQDILLLAHHYLSIFRRKQRRPARRFSPATEQAMLEHTWPGNLRELRNAVERAVILALRDVLEPADLGLTSVVSPDWDVSQAVRIGAPVSLELLEREHIARVVAQASSLEAAARTLDIDATTLQRKRKRYGLA
jgi:DNA-binding NtrC family response regulator